MAREIITIRIVYNSGYTHDFDVYSFRIDGNRYQWEEADQYNRPVKMGADNIVAVWQVGVRISE